MRACIAFLPFNSVTSVTLRAKEMEFTNKTKHDYLTKITFINSTFPADMGQGAGTHRG